MLTLDDIRSAAGTLNLTWSRLKLVVEPGARHHRPR